MRCFLFCERSAVEFDEPVSDPLPPWRIPAVKRPASQPAFTVSAIVSTYQSETFIEGCLLDLTEQNLFKKGEVEIIVIDSGSPENEGGIVAKFQEKHPNIVYLRTEREPLYTAWNRAIGLARGHYLTNANTDDRHRADALELLARTLDEKPEIALAYGDMVLTSIPNGRFGEAADAKLFPFAPFSVTALLGEERCGPHPMWRASLHDEFGGFCEDFKVASDYEWWLRLCQKYPLHHIPEALSLYLKRPDSIEHRQLELCARETEIIRNYYCERLGVRPEDIRLKPKAAIPRFFWRLNRSIKKRLAHR
jgi:glycosyltransferase involved in cell wall biosynthesis